MQARKAKGRVQWGEARGDGCRAAPRCAIFECSTTQKLSQLFAGDTLGRCAVDIKARRARLPRTTCWSCEGRRSVHRPCHNAACPCAQAWPWTACSQRPEIDAGLHVCMHVCVCMECEHKLTSSHQACGGRQRAVQASTGQPRGRQGGQQCGGEHTGRHAGGAAGGSVLKGGANAGRWSGVAARVGFRFCGLQRPERGLEGRVREQPGTVKGGCAEGSSFL